MTADRADSSFVIYKPWFVTLFKRRFGFEYSRVGLGETPYLDRYIAYIGGPTLRLHKFWRGDDDRAPHDHPWRFWTFPLTSYVEMVEQWDGDEDYGEWLPGWKRFDRVVRAFRIHYRPAKYRHVVLGQLRKLNKPFWTFVVTCSVENGWGFWPTPTTFVPWREWPAFVRKYFGAKI
jgi:hypothetical protein